RLVRTATGRRNPETTNGVFFDELITAGERLIDALRLERNFNKIDLTEETEDGMLETWRLQRAEADGIAADYALAVSDWPRRVPKCPAVRDKLFCILSRVGTGRQDRA